MNDTASDVEMLRRAEKAADRLRSEVAKAVVGQEAVFDRMLVALISGGHTLLVGVPGLAKTLLVSSLARALNLGFGRVQFTPDLLPADITGTDVLREQDGRRQLEFVKGPIFHNLVLADEINRTPPKTQAALLQAMQEREVTVGAHTHKLPSPFQVFATRNPIEQEGTYALPEAQRDRFMLEVEVDYPTEEQERQVALRTTSGDIPQLEPVVEHEELRAMIDLVPRVPISDAAVAYAVSVVRRSRPGNVDAPSEVGEYVRFGAGPRGSQSLVLGAKALAVLRGEPVADVDHVRDLVVPTLQHRVVLSYRAEADGVDPRRILDAIVSGMQ